MRNLKQNSLLLIGLLLLAITSCKKSSDTTPPPPPPPVLPVVNSFSPATGSAGTTVTISGKNFSPTIANDVVSFSGIAATVTSATADQIIVTVPNDAATGKINVKVSSNSAASADNFTVTLNELSEARSGLAGAAIGNKILFAGGLRMDVNLSKTVDVYDLGTNAWNTAQLSIEKSYSFAAGTGDKVVFGGSSNNSVDIYDTSTSTWSTAQLSVARFGLATAAAGNKILIAGGYDPHGLYSNIVDIYDASTNSWSTSQLSEARSGLAGAATGNKIVFAGGQSESPFIGAPSKTVDIYDVSTNTWITAQLSEAREGLIAAATGNKIVFAGGQSGSFPPSKTVDIYDVVTNTWSTAQLSEARGHLAAAATGNKILFAGGLNFDGGIPNTIPSKTVDVYDVTTNTWTTAQLSEARWNLAGAATGNKIVFAGGKNNEFSAYPDNPLKTVDIYDVQTGVWYH